MRRIETEILVIGGGATGTGILRDLAMRGFKSLLVEKRDLTHGTTGRYHGLLHSGGRYVVKDPQAARECIEENIILRRIMPHCIEDTGGYFVITPWDDLEYIPKFLEGCHKANIPVEEVPLNKMLHKEPLLNPKISHCFYVPDASADSFLATEANVDSAKLFGATALRYHEVTHLLLSNSRVVGARCHDLVNDDTLEITADLVINASGAWAAKVAVTAGLELQVIPGKGVMIATNHRIINTVINRCKMPSDGDILVPAHTVAIIGTTDVRVDDPDHFPIEPWEVSLMLEEGEKLIPGFKNLRMLRAWAGVRPLYMESKVTETRDVSRAFVLLDHEKRDGVSGLITITSGKWTTYRKMAEVTVDMVCEKLGVQRSCRTHLEILPSAQAHKYHTLGNRLEYIEKNQLYGNLICECELATYQDVVEAITKRQAITIDDIRRDIRLGMGPCQGGFCTYRVAGILHKLSHPSVEDTNLALVDFLSERWKGLIHILWGQQLRQERLDELIYLSLLNTDHLPHPSESRLAPIPYEPPVSAELFTKPNQSSDGYVLAKSLDPDKTKFIEKAIESPRRADVLVIGAGLSGLMNALQLSKRNASVKLIAKGWGSMYWHSGCIDVLGYFPLDHANPIESPLARLPLLIQESPQHPYSLVGIDQIQEAIETFQSFCLAEGYPMLGSIDKNWLLPSALGAFRPTCLAPETMVAGDLYRQDPMVIVGFENHHDFYPGLIAENLSAQAIPATAIILDIPFLRGRKNLSTRNLALLFEEDEFQGQVISAIKLNLKGEAARATRIGFPAVLGFSRSGVIKNFLEQSLGISIFEIPTIPPSIPGMRLSNILVSAIQRLGGSVMEGFQATGAEISGSKADDPYRLVSILSQSANRDLPYYAKNFVLATGGILGGGISFDFEGTPQENVIGLPVLVPSDRLSWFNRDFLHPSGHPIFRSGIIVDDDFHPLTEQNHIAYQNLFAVGATLAGGDYLRERSYDGVAITTGYTVGKQI